MLIETPFPSTPDLFPDRLAQPEVVLESPEAKLDCGRPDPVHLRLFYASINLLRYENIALETLWLLVAYVHLLSYNTS